MLDLIFASLVLIGIIYKLPEYVFCNIMLLFIIIIVGVLLTVTFSSFTFAALSLVSFGYTCKFIFSSPVLNPETPELYIHIRDKIKGFFK